MNTLPKARNENIIMQDAGDEILIYDTITDKAYCLNETSAKVFNACDGKQTFDELKSQYQFNDDLVYLALDELKAKDLLDSAANYETPFAGMTRREVIRKVGFATMIALPVVSSLIAPSAAQAASGGTTANCQVCTSNAQCISGRCRTAFPNNGTSICSAGTTNGQVGQTGAIFGAADAGACTSAASIQCCNGSTGASFNNNTCTCG